MIDQKYNISINKCKSSLVLWVKDTSVSVFSNEI